MPKAMSRKNRKQKPKKLVTKTHSANDQSGSILSAWQLFRYAGSVLWDNKKLFAGIIGVIGIVQLFVVQGIVQTDFVAVDKEMRDLVGSTALGIGSGVASYAYLLGASGQNSSTGLLQSLFIVLAILAVLWVQRELAAGKQPSIRDAFYKSTAQLVPFLLVSLWFAVQLLPALLGAWLYSVVVTNNITVHTYEQLIWLVIFILLAVISTRLIAGTIFALCIATLSDMTPIAAIRSARNLVRGRRLQVVKKLLFMVVGVFIVMTLVIVPAIIVVPVIVPILFYLTSLLAVVFITLYVFALYRELLK
jgi:hypothetical protein